MKILTVIGNRPQFVKAAAVSTKLRERVEEVLVHTGQHYDRALSEVFFEELKLPPPDHMLGAGSGSHAEMTGSMMNSLEPLVDEVAPDALLVYGDTDSTLAGALVAAKAEVPIAHVEAGMRSFNRSMPEEVNRVVADALSGLSLCPTEVAVRNLEAEGLGDTARLVGDVMADVALIFGPIADERSDILDRLGLAERSYCVATAHRAGNVDDPESLGKLLDVLERGAAEAPVVFAVHPRTKARLEAGVGLDGLEARGIRAIDPVGYLDITRLVRNSRAVLNRLRRAPEGGVPGERPLRDDARGDRVGRDRRDRLEPPRRARRRRRRRGPGRAAEARRAHLPRGRALRRRERPASGSPRRSRDGWRTARDRGIPRSPPTPSSAQHVVDPRRDRGRRGLRLPGPRRRRQAAEARRPLDRLARGSPARDRSATASRSARAR